MEYSRNLYFFVFAVILWTTFSYANCKHCRYAYESGYVMHFFCGAYEYCCGPECCRSHTISFYQIWYFWLMLILMLLLCSGGGWWYRFRYRDQFQSQDSHLAYAGTAAPASPAVHIYGAKPYEGPFTAFGPPPPYPLQTPAVHPTQQTSTYGTATVMQQTPATTGSPPPPYTGPPPCYTDATGRTTSSSNN